MIPVSHVVAAVRRRIVSRWRGYWVRRSGPHGPARIAARLAAVGTPPYHGREFLSYLDPRGFIAPTASVSKSNLALGQHVFIGDYVIVSSGPDGGPVEFGDSVQLYGDTFIHTAAGGKLTIKSGTHIQPGAYIVACISEIRIGRNVEIAPRCALYSYNHGMAPGTPIMSQPLESKGPITIGDYAWLGHGVIVLSGVHIGAGAVIGAGSVVAFDIPDNAIATGNPAQVIKIRGRQRGSRDVLAATS